MIELASVIPSDLSPAAAWLQRVRELPVAEWGVVVVMLVAGLMLWLVGARFLKASLIVFGAAAGCLGASMASDELGWRSDPILPATIGLVAGAVVGWMSFRYAAGVLLAIVCAGLVPLVVLVTNPWTHWLGTPRDGERITHADAPLPTPAPDDEDSSTSALGVRADPLIRPVLMRLNEGLEPIRDAIPDDGLRPLALAAAGGAIIGFGMGLVLPRRGAAFASATIGSALWLPALGAGVLSQGIKIPDPMLDNPVVWVGLWSGVALLGTSIQWTNLRKKADNAGHQSHPGT